MDKIYKFEVDGEELVSDRKRLTPNEILKISRPDDDLSNYYLVQIEDGKMQFKYKDLPDSLTIGVEGRKFITVYIGATTNQ